jgi:hypothetical protein
MESVDMSTRISSTLHTVRSHDMILGIITPTGHSDPSSPPSVSGGATVTDQGIFVRVAQDVEEQIIRFELWDAEPPPASSEDHLPETLDTFTIDITTGELAVRGRKGLIRNAFTVGAGRYYARVAGRRREWAREQAAIGGGFDGRENYTIQLWPERVPAGGGLVAAAEQVAPTGYGMFGFCDEGDGPEPEYSSGWFSATTGAVHVHPMCELPEPGVRFELWTDGPSRDVTDMGDEPEVQTRLKFRVRHGSISLYATGAYPGVFELPLGWYHLHLLGYRRSVMPDIEKDLYARAIAPGDDEWERAEGIELYVAKFWPMHDDSPHEMEAGQQTGDVRLEAIRTWAKSKGLAVNDSGPIPPSVLAQYDANQ